MWLRGSKNTVIYHLVVTLKFANNLQSWLDFDQVYLTVAVCSSYHLSVQIKREAADRSRWYPDLLVICTQSFIPKLHDAVSAPCGKLVALRAEAHTLATRLMSKGFECYLRWWVALVKTHRDHITGCTTSILALKQRRRCSIFLLVIIVYLTRVYKLLLGFLKLCSIVLKSGSLVL